MSVAVTKPDWIAVDWGTTHLRVWLMAADGTVVEQRTSDKGMGGLGPDEFGPTLESILFDVVGRKKLPVIICGMAGARKGWVEAPYSTVPCHPPGIEQSVRVSSMNLDAHILPGIKQNSPADVMRGEETQILGFLSGEPNFDGVLCLPGTHTKWAHISAGEVVSFRTFMTGELFSLISEKSVLRHSVGSKNWDQNAFELGIADALSRPSELAAKLFSLRAETLLDDLAPAAARSRLSAILIGEELVAAKPYWLGKSIVVLGETGVAAHYQSALLAQGVSVRSVDTTATTLSGLKAAYQHIQRHAS